MNCGALKPKTEKKKKKKIKVIIFESVSFFFVINYLSRWDRVYVMDTERP